MPASAAGDLSQSFTVDGQLFQASADEPLLDSDVTIVVQILDPSKKCLLLEEEHKQIDTSSKNGFYSITVGSPVGSSLRSTNDPGRTMVEIFQNGKDIISKNVPGQTCVDLTYKPTANDARYLRLIVIPSATNVPDTLSPDTVLGAVPSAIVAQSLQGFDSSQLLKLNASTLTQNNVENIFNRYTKLDAILTNFDATATTLTSNISGNAATATTAVTISGTVPAAKVTGLAGVATSGSFNDLSDKPASVPSPSGNSGKFLTTDGTDLSWATVSIPNAHPIDDDQKFMKFVNGSGWQPHFVKLSELKNFAGTASAFNVGIAGCTSAQTLTWTSITDEFQCQDISLPAAKVTGLGTVATTNSYNDLTNKPWGAVNGGISYMGDNIGVGTETLNLNSKLLVKGTIANDVPAPIVGPNVDLSLGNTLILTDVGGTTINLSNMVHGGSYTLVVQDMTSRTYTFSGCTNSKFLPTNSNTIENTHTIYTILTVTNGVNFDCYITWATGY